VENLTNLSEQKASQQNNTNVMSLVAELYAKREVMPMQAEPDETTQPEE
jgi:hypothetical protein